MNELALALNGNSAAAPPAHILESLDGEMAQRRVSGTPHTIYEELWHLAFWQSRSLDWIEGRETPCPERTGEGFPDQRQIGEEPFPELRARFLDGAERSAALAAGPEEALQSVIRCPSPAGRPARSMTVREQLESLAAHNAYHLGRIVLLRQMLGCWPPLSGGFTW